jgi:hypothetical protein
MGPTGLGDYCQLMMVGAVTRCRPDNATQASRFLPNPKQQTDF